VYRFLMCCGFVREDRETVGDEGNFVSYSSFGCPVLIRFYLGSE
jgi:hypothetical protein